MVTILGDRSLDQIGRMIDQPTTSSYMVFGFFEIGGGDQDSSESSWGSGEDNIYTGRDFIENDAGDDDDVSSNVEANRVYWEEQDQLLQSTLYRTSSLESKIRQLTKDALKELALVDTCCVCRKPVAGGCRACFRREISNRLCNAGYNCVICTSKWRSSPDIQAGQHTYLEVIDKSNSKKGDTKLIIELNFRSEFEMARASTEYNGLISRLPEVFVGKSERLRDLIKILCSAAKKSTKDKKMHMGPWRKQKYMQAKWFGTCERMTFALSLQVGNLDRQLKPRASMLTFDLLDNLHYNAGVQVV